MSRKLKKIKPPSHHGLCVILCTYILLFLSPLNCERSFQSKQLNSFLPRSVILCPTMSPPSPPPWAVMVQDNPGGLSRMKADLISHSLTYTSSRLEGDKVVCLHLCVYVIKAQQLTLKSLNQPGHFYCQHITNSNAEAICFSWETVQQADLQLVHPHKYVVTSTVH